MEISTTDEHGRDCGNKNAGTDSADISEDFIMKVGNSVV